MRTTLHGCRVRDTQCSNGLRIHSISQSVPCIRPEIPYLVVLYLKMFSCGFEGTLTGYGRLDFVGTNLLTQHSCYSCGLPIGSLSALIQEVTLSLVNKI